MRRGWMIAAFALLLPLNARAIVVMEESFLNNSAAFTDSSGTWKGSYCGDKWRTDLNDGVIAGMDDGCETCGCDFVAYSSSSDTCIDSDPFDNHIQSGDINWQNYIFEVSFQNQDDDTLGVVFRYRRSDHFYLFMLSLDQMPDPFSGCGTTYAGARLIRFLPGVSPTVIKQDSNFKYTSGLAHDLKITVTGRHIRIEMDRNGDGVLSPSEIFFDGDDISNLAIYSGKVGLYSYENGAFQDWEESPCSSGGCWFDDVRVTLLPPNNVDCGTVPAEGSCSGNTLQVCDETGHLAATECPEAGCCGWHDEEGFYTCLPSTMCAGLCENACGEGEAGCSGNLSHRWICGQGDSDPCLEPAFSACVNGYCNPATGSCVTGCVPQCAGKNCGDDGCGGSCGSCPSQYACQLGQCVPSTALGETGDACSSQADCQSGLCVDLVEQSLCTQLCAPGLDCPAGWVCSLEIVGSVCIPQGSCVPNCTQKECGDDGCGGTCGGCPQTQECKGGKCKTKAGATCYASADCSSGICLPFEEGRMCTTPCSTDSGCPSGWFCSPWLDPTTPSVCAPSHDESDFEACEELSSCVDACPSGSQSCMVQCFFTGSDAAAARYSALFICMALQCNGCQDDSCTTECIFQDCFPQYASCFPGTLSCEKSLGCIFSCGAAGQSCIDECFSSALPSAKAVLVRLFACVETVCPSLTQQCLTDALEETCRSSYDECLSACVPQCGDRECGTDGCGGSCGTCKEGTSCVDGTCRVDCAPDCDGRQCGSDGCGSTCGVCRENFVCVSGACVSESDCQPMDHLDCAGGNLFWFDSCNRPGEMAMDCPDGCVDGDCLSPQDPEDAVGEGEAYLGLDPSQDPVELSAGSKANCTQQGKSDLDIMVILLALSLALLCVRWRSRHVN